MGKQEKKTLQFFLFFCHYLQVFQRLPEPQYCPRAEDVLLLYVVPQYSCCVLVESRLTLIKELCR